MPIDERLAREARAAAAHVAARQAEVESARAAFARAVRALHSAGGSPAEIGVALGLGRHRVHEILGLPAPPDVVARGQRTCSFCARPQAAVRKLICGPDGVGICNDCLTPATAVVRVGGPAADARASVTPAVPGTRCSFCGKAAARRLPAATGAGATICAECVDLCHEILAGESV